MKKVWEKQIADIFSTRSKKEEEQFFKIISLFLYNRENDQLTTLYRELGQDMFSRVIDVLGGENIILPNREEYRDMNLVALCYYLKEMKGMSWTEIHEALPFDNLNSIKYGKWIGKLSKDIRKEINVIFNTFKEKELNISDFISR